MTKENPSGGIPGRGFPRRVYPARVIGVGLGFISVAGVFVSAGAPPWVWLLLTLNGFVWPHIAFVSARRAADPSRAERHNLMIDALAGGFWVALMQFNMLPSALLLAMLSMDNMALGGMRLFLRGLLAHLGGIAAGVLLVGWAPAPVTDVRQILFCLPFLLIYPQLVGNITYQLAQRLDAEKRGLLQRTRIDALTSLWNRAYWEERALAELSRSQRQGAPAVLVIADIDHFKNINDHFGHGVGDQVLRRLSALLHKELRISDLLCRYGGEEFAMVLPDTDNVGALAIIERLRDTVMRCDLGPDYPGRVTVSFGLAQLEPAIADLPAWIEAADTALYQAKQAGRNRSVVYGSQDPVSSAG
ncbi:MAG: diguanylate cyclase [Gammaproteobacteria bacterium]|nr:diguanylate cyclase [Gammaproteobacteria bacterium]